MEKKMETTIRGVIRVILGLYWDYMLYTVSMVLKGCQGLYGFESFGVKSKVLGRPLDALRSQ